MRIAYKHKRDGIKISSHIAFPFISFSQNFLPTSLHFLLHHVASLLISFYCIRFEVLSPEIKFIMQVNTYHYYRNGLLPRLKPPIYHGSTVVTAPVAFAQLPRFKAEPWQLMICYHGSKCVTVAIACLYCHG